MRYRATTHASVYVEALDREVHLNPYTVVDDRNKDDRELLAQYPELFEPDTDTVESATAAPGERRSTRRK